MTPPSCLGSGSGGEAPSPRQPSHFPYNKSSPKKIADAPPLVPGEPWQEALEEALDQSRTCAVFLGKTLGPWQNEEMRWRWRRASAMPASG